MSYARNRKMKESTICKSEKADFLPFMQNQVREKKTRNKIKTSANCRTSLRSFAHFPPAKGFRRPVSLDTITEELSAPYETYLRHERGVTRNFNALLPRNTYPRYYCFIQVSQVDLSWLYGAYMDGIGRRVTRGLPLKSRAYLTAFGNLHTKIVLRQTKNFLQEKKIFFCGEQFFVWRRTFHAFQVLEYQTC